LVPLTGIPLQTPDAITEKALPELEAKMNMLTMASKTAAMPRMI